MISWWPQERITPTELEVLGMEPLDVLVTHDCPAGIDLPSHWTLRDADQAVCDEQRSLLAEAVRRTQPRLVLHGHWHHRHTSVLQLSGSSSAKVEGLANDGCGDDAMLVVDLDEIS